MVQNQGEQIKSLFFVYRSMWVLNEVIMLNGEIKNKLTVEASVVMSKFHSSCWETMVYKSKSEVFIDSREVVNGVKVIPGYVVTSCGMSFVFRNETFPCNFFIWLGSNRTIDVVMSVLITNIYFERRWGNICVYGKFSVCCCYFIDCYI